MTNSKEYNKYSDGKVFPAELIYEAFHNMAYRLQNYKARNPYSWDAFDDYELHDGYSAYVHERIDSCFADMTSVRFINRVMDVTEDGEYEIMGKKMTTNNRSTESLAVNSHRLAGFLMLKGHVLKEETNDELG